MRVLPELPVFPTPQPARDPHTWRLRVHGLVAYPLTLTAEDLLKLPTRKLVDDFHCEEGWVVSNLEWEGVPVKEVLRAAEPLAEAGYATFSQGDFSLVLTLEEAGASNALLALRLNGQPLPAAHGAPCRLVVAGKECYCSVKRLERIEVTSDRPATTAREIALRRIGNKSAPGNVLSFS